MFYISDSQSLYTVCGLIIVNIQHRLHLTMMLFQETGSTDVLYMQLDLASLKSIRCFTETFLKSESRLDLLINNAGTRKHTHTITKRQVIYGFFKSETRVCHKPEQLQSLVATSGKYCRLQFTKVKSEHLLSLTKYRTINILVFNNSSFENMQISLTSSDCGCVCG